MKDEFILKLIEKFENGQSVVLHIKQGDCELLLKKEEAFPKPESTQPVYAAPLPAAPAQQLPSAGMPQQTEVRPAQAAPPAPSPAADNLTQIKSPIVGTFYRAPSPDSPPYVEKGSTVKKGQPLCVLEAMKMMNTLECEFDGVIEDILVANGELVEFDQPIFTIKIK